MRPWQELTQMLGGHRLIVERVRDPDRGIAIEGAFEPPPLAQLSFEDQVFVSAFVKSHGSIKQMEELFGISYPTVKGRLNKIAEQMAVVDVSPPRGESNQNQALDLLAKGELSVEEAIERMRR